MIPRPFVLIVVGFREWDWDFDQMSAAFFSAEDRCLCTVLHILCESDCSKTTSCRMKARAGVAWEEQNVGVGTEGLKATDAYVVVLGGAGEHACEDVVELTRGAQQTTGVHRPTRHLDEACWRHPTWIVAHARDKDGKPVRFLARNAWGFSPDGRRGLVE